MERAELRLKLTAIKNAGHCSGNIKGGRVSWTGQHWNCITSFPARHWILRCCRIRHFFLFIIFRFSPLSSTSSIPLFAPSLFVSRTIVEKVDLFHLVIYIIRFRRWPIHAECRPLWSPGGLRLCHVCRCFAFFRSTEGATKDTCKIFFCEWYLEITDYVHQTATRIARITTVVANTRQTRAMAHLARHFYASYCSNIPSRTIASLNKWSRPCGQKIPSHMNDSSSSGWA